VKDHLELFPFQRETVRRVREDLQWRAIIADEVGLGKTIEAGALVEEIVGADPGARILLLTPKALLMQWRGELLHKFGLFVHLEEELRPSQLRALNRPAIIAMTHDKLAVTSDEHPALTEDWSLVVVDEAHRFSNPETVRRKRLAEIRSGRLVLLTATPMQNSLVDIYSLTDLLRPKILAHSPKAFLEQFAFDEEGRQVKVSMRRYLKDALSACLTRTTREQAGIKFVDRVVRTVIIQPGDNEKYLMRVLKDLIAEGQSDLAAMSIHQAIASHPAAAAKALERYFKGIGVKVGRKSVKEDALVDLVAAGTAGPWLVFANRIVTGRALVKRLEEEGVTAAFYHGGLSTKLRDTTIEWFRTGKVQVLVATDAGSEGLNLQHCSRVVNYDLHWNPLRMEQRIGRVHRFGQTSAVQIVNFALDGSLDKAILDRIHTKIDLFQRVIGELTTIIGTSATLAEIRLQIEAACTAPTFDKMDERLTEIGERMQYEIEAAADLAAAQPF
jgi:SNF2 family DNA or RNA helicase